MPRVQSDDMGYNELNYMNATRGLSTPNIDALATTGVAFHNWCAVLRRVRHQLAFPTIHSEYLSASLVRSLDLCLGCFCGTGSTGRGGNNIEGLVTSSPLPPSPAAGFCYYILHCWKQINNTKAQ